MRLPEDYEEHSGLTPTVVTAIVAVTLFVGAILVVVLLMNGSPNRKKTVVQQNNEQASVEAIQERPFPVS